MNKKIVIGSILAVFVLVAISLTLTIGGVNIDKNSSPLYNVRAQQAIGQQSTVSDSADYIGFGMENVHIPEFRTLYGGVQQRPTYPTPCSFFMYTCITWLTCMLFCQFFSIDPGCNY